MNNTLLALCISHIIVFCAGLYLSHGTRTKRQNIRDSNGHTESSGELRTNVTAQGIPIVHLFDALRDVEDYPPVETQSPQRKKKGTPGRRAGRKDKQVVEAHRGRIEGRTNKNRLKVSRKNDGLTQ